MNKIIKNIIIGDNIPNNPENTNVENITKNKNITENNKEEIKGQNKSKVENKTKEIREENKNDNKSTKISDIPIKETEEEINRKKKAIYKEYKFPSLQESFNKAKNFLDKSSRGILLNDKSKFISSEHPLVSAIVPVYNSRNLVNRAIKSIQNQNLLDIEIILINDFSTDNSLSIIEGIQKEDPRIKIINNKKNMGILYSRSIGALSSKGKYIFCLDNDDMFLDFDVFSTITNIANEGDVDVIEFKGAMSRHARNIINTYVEDIYFSKEKSNFVLFQPELGDYTLTPKKEYDKYDISTVFLWCKCVKGEIYKKALNKLGKEKYSRYMIAHEDLVGTFIILNTANSYKYVGKYGIYNIVRGGSAIYLNRDVLNSVKEIYLTDVVIDFAKNTNGFKKIIPALIFDVLNLNNLEKVINMDNNREIVHSCLSRALKLDFVPNESKKRIVEKIKRLKYINFPLDSHSNSFFLFSNDKKYINYNKFILFIFLLNLIIY